MTWSPEVRLVAYRTALKRLDGATLTILTADDVPIAALQFPSPAVRGDHTAPLVPDEACEGEGEATKFGITDTRGNLIKHGTVGAMGSGADLELPDIYITRGSRVSIEAGRVVECDG